MSKRTRRYNRAKTSGTEARRYGQQAGAGGMPATVRTADPTAPQAASASPVNMTLSLSLPSSGTGAQTTAGR